MKPQPLSFFAYGLPAPQGSKSFRGMRNGKPILAESSANVKPWRQAVSWFAMEAMGGRQAPYFRGAVAVELGFRLPMLKSGKDWRCTARPDLDKLIRSTFDALTDAGVWEDDSRVVTIVAYKSRDARTGCNIMIRSEE